MGFRFSLAALLKVRALLEQRERSALEAAVAAQQNQQQRLQAATDIGAAHVGSVRGALAEGLLASELHWSTLRTHGMARAREQAEQVLRNLESARLDHTQRYRKVHSELEAVEQLKSDKLSEYMAESAKREQNLIDSLHLAKIVRKESNRQRAENISLRSS